MRRIRNAVIELIVIASIIPRPGSAQEPVSARREAVRGWVGVAYTTSMAQMDRDGTMMFKDYPVIESIEPNSPAEKAGMLLGDVLLEANGGELGGADDLLDALSSVSKGGALTLKFLRGGSAKTASISRRDR